MSKEDPPTPVQHEPEVHHLQSGVAFGTVGFQPNPDEEEDEDE
jgi:hypothetical protein